MQQEGKAEALKNLVVYGDLSEENRKLAEESEFTVYTYEQIIEAGRDHEMEFDTPDREHIYLFSYTSGTTG